MALLEEAGRAAMLFKTLSGRERGQDSRKRKLQRIKLVTSWAKHKQQKRSVLWAGDTLWPGLVMVTKPIGIPKWQQLMQQVQRGFVSFLNAGCTAAMMAAEGRQPHCHKQSALSVILKII